FDYRPAPGLDPAVLTPGVRVRVPFGRRRMIGIYIEPADRSHLPARKLRPALEVLDTEPVLDRDLLEFIRWAADYYHHPLGEALAAALPAGVRAGRAVKALSPAAQRRK